MFIKELNELFEFIVQNPSSLPSELNNVLLIASFSLDSIAPEILTTSSIHSFPNNMLGINIKNSIIQEKLFTKHDYEKKNISFQNGIYKKNSITFDINLWNLYKNQRVGFQFNMFETLIETLLCLKNSHILIIDEFSPLPFPQMTQHNHLPVTLNIKDRNDFDFSRCYKNAGKYLYYFPLYLSTMYDLLKSYGCTNVIYNTENKFISNYKKKKTYNDIFSSLCFGLFAKIVIPSFSKKASIIPPHEMGIPS